MSMESTPFDKAANRYEAEDRDLEAALANIWSIAEENHLDPFPTHFEVVPPNVISEIGSYGLPERYSHWTHGREYRQIKTMYDWGLSKIYELVINSNPAQAYLMENNPPIENKLVMAHVLAHSDFFKNNKLFAPTRRDMPEAAAHNAVRIQGYEEQYGKMAVEQLLDATLSIEEHVDPYRPNRPQKEDELRNWREQASRKRRPHESIPAGQFDDIFDIASKPVLQAIHDQHTEALHIPPEPDRDILGFIRNHGPNLQEWQRDVIDIVRSESIYFYPQRRTKIMNEGWAAYWHKRIMREMSDRNLISDKDNEIWWRQHSGVVAPDPKRINPYYLGMKMYEYLEDYYNGTLSAEENDWLIKEHIPVQPRFEGRLEDSPAIPALRDIMIHNDDQSFIRNHFNKIVADRMDMYIYEERVDFDGEVDYVVIDNGWQKIRDMLVSSMDNSGMPYITVVDGDYNNANQLYLRHEYEGKALDPDYIKKTLPYIFRLWQKPVHLEARSDKANRVYSYDGTEVSEKRISF